MTVTADRPLLDVTVLGVPRPQGSLSLMGVTAGGKPRLKNSDTVIEWRNTVVTDITTKLPPGWTPAVGPVAVRVAFSLPRPKAHFRANGELKPGAPSWVANGADLDKLVRAVGDALTVAGVVTDDRVIALTRSEKRYVNAEGALSLPGARIEVYAL